MMLHILEAPRHLESTLDSPGMQQNGRPHSTPTESTLAPFSPCKVGGPTVTQNP